jgi:hypothetical protein
MPNSLDPKLSEAILTLPDAVRDWVDKPPSSESIAPPQDRRTVVRGAVEELAESDGVRSEEKSLNVRYEWAVLMPDATMDDDGMVIHRSDCPPGSKQVWCAVCGVKMVATSNRSKAFFRHQAEKWPFGTSDRRDMDLPDGNPPWRSDPSDKGDVTYPEHGWQWDKIHRVLGDPVATPNLRDTTESLQKVPVPVTFQYIDGRWEVWAISPAGDESNRFKVVDSSKSIEYGGTVWYRIDSLDEPTTIRTSDGSETIRWPISKRVIIGEVEGTFNHHRFHHSSETGSGNFHIKTREGEKPDLVIGGIGFSQSHRIDTPRFVPALPTVDGTIPYLTDSDIVPVEVINRASDITRVESLGALEPWSLSGQVHLNAASFRNDTTPLPINPAVLLSQLNPRRGTGISRIDLYPTREIPIPGSVKVLIDDQSFPAQATSKVEAIPDRVSIQDSQGNQHALTQANANTRYLDLGEQWAVYGGPLGDVLQRLRDDGASAFAIIIKPNSNPFNLIMISKALPKQPDQSRFVGVDYLMGGEVEEFAKSISPAVGDSTPESELIQAVEPDPTPAVEPEATPKREATPPPQSLKESQKQFPGLTRRRYRRALHLAPWSETYDGAKDKWKALRAHIGKSVEDGQ